MTRVLKSSFVAFVLIALPSVRADAQANINALSCSKTDVSNALALATDGTTVHIPAGTCAWSTTLSITVPGALTIMGAGSQTIQGGGDATIITDNVPKTGFPTSALIVNTVTGKPFRLTAITFQGGSGGTGFNGSIQINGTSQQVRVDHVHFLNLHDTAIAFLGWEYGVLDDCLFDFVSGSTNNGVRVQHGQWNGDTGPNGDVAYADLSFLGSGKAIFIENNTFNSLPLTYSDGFFNGATTDSQLGGRFVFRFNIINRAITQNHGTQDRRRGNRTFEFYNNIFDWRCNPNCTSDQGSFAIFLRSGTGVVWQNTSTGFVNLVSAHNDRSETQFTFPDWVTAGSTQGFCNGSDLWDQNTGATGYPCLDQIGRGTGDLITGSPPLNTTTHTTAWPHQALEPTYEWLDTYNPPPFNGFDAVWRSAQSIIAPNRDFYLFSSTFNGTSGVGAGLLAQRPATCTPLVAFWATDTSTLYQCTATNTWTVYYTPFTYPHPLIPPPPPVNSR